MGFMLRFTDEETVMLIKLHMKYGNNWITIGQHMNRTATNVRDRWKVMEKVGKSKKAGLTYVYQQVYF